MEQINDLSSVGQQNGLTAFVPQVALQPVPNSLPRGRILVLEDDPLQLRLLKEHLEAIDFEVVTAASIAEARQRMSDTIVQLAIFDVQLPDGSGFEFCEQLDNAPATVGLPIIVLSSLTESSAIRQTRASGGRYFLGKPYDPNVLLAIIERALEE